MLAPSGNLLRAGLALKANHVKLATRSYLRDRTRQATDSVTSYAVAAGLFAAAGIFLIAACLVGIAALFRWIELNYGLFQAFGATGALLVVLAAILAGIASARLKRRPRQFPSLASRLRVAIKAPPRLTATDSAKDAGAAVLMDSPTPPGRPAARPQFAASGKTNGKTNGRTAQIGLIVMAALLGVAAARRRRLSRDMAPDAPTTVR
ncbi:phage holin family protein [Bradyrhizobium sp.]|uniref:phage holin family protein n=1 Tax=Bradyrhizobium sp. TaxID=376 RepID=UPI003C4B88F0